MRLFSVFTNSSTLKTLTNNKAYPKPEKALLNKSIFPNLGAIGRTETCFPNSVNALSFTS